MRIVHDSVGGFTGPAGKQSRALDLARLPDPAAAQLRALVDRVPADTWGREVLAPVVKSYDFRHTIRIIADDGTERSVAFHERAAPPELQQLLGAIRDAE